MKISFSDIKPYTRFIRCLQLDAGSVYPVSVPYDSRLFYTLSGQGKIATQDRVYEMERGTLIIINSGVEYHILTPDESVTYLAVNFDYTFSSFDKKAPVLPAVRGEYDCDRLIEHVTFCDTECLNEVFYLNGMQKLEGALLSMREKYTQKLSMYELSLCADMTEILIRALRRAMNGEMSESEGRVSEILAYIQQNYTKSLTNTQVAQRFHYHPNYVSDLLKRYTGYPLHRYIKNLRISKACELLSGTDKSILQIAEELGFYDGCHFVRCFKDVLGMTPKEYRIIYR